MMSPLCFLPAHRASDSPPNNHDPRDIIKSLALKCLESGSINRLQEIRAAFDAVTHVVLANATSAPSALRQLF